MFPSADEGAKLTIIWVNPLQCGAVHAKHMQTYLSNRPAVLLWPDAEIKKKKRGTLCAGSARGESAEAPVHPTSVFAAVCTFTGQVYSHYDASYLKSGCTHIIQLWHDGAAAPHFKLKQVEDLLRVAQRLQDVHVASDVQLLLRQTDVRTCQADLHQSEMQQWQQQQPRERSRLPVRSLVRSTDASDWLAGHGLSAPPPMSEQSVWCDAPPQCSVSGARLLIGQRFIGEGNPTCSF